MSSVPLTYTPVQGAIELPSMEVLNPPKGVTGYKGQVVLRIFHRVNDMIIHCEEVPIPVYNMRVCDINMFLFLDPMMLQGGAPLAASAFASR